MHFSKPMDVNPMNRYGNAARNLIDLYGTVMYMTKPYNNGGNNENRIINIPSIILILYFSVNYFNNLLACDHITLSHDFFYSTLRYIIVVFMEPTSLNV